MKFKYVEMSSSSVSGMRIYESPLTKKAYPSITTVLSKTMPVEKAKSLSEWRKRIGDEKADAISKEATDNGTAVHLLIEKYLNKDQINSSEFTQDQLSSLNSLKIKLKNINEVWGQEICLYSDSLAIAGRCDCVGIYKNKECIIDFKTSKKIKYEADIEDYFLQLNAYRHMHNEMFGTNIQHGVILMVTNSSYPQEFLKKLDEFDDKLKNRVNSFYKLLL